MAKIRITFVWVLLCLTVIGCQENHLNVSKPVTHIEIYDWESEQLKGVIDDKPFIEKLVKELNSANTASTANLDFRMPDDKLLFKHQEEVLLEIGYFIDLMNVKVKGRYWDFQEDEFYAVRLELPDF